MNLIVEKVPHVKWYSDLQPFVAALGHRVHDYVWRFDEVGGNVVLPDGKREGSYWLLSGGEFEGLVEHHPQFVWAVVSAIPTRCSGSEIATQCDPYADGNPAFWTGSPTPQHPFAQFELVCWDASATLLIGGDASITAAFREAYPESIDLDQLNEDRDGTKR